ncbi:MAG: dTDP-4-dehydrorhamnose 3,5-epimerase family protein, partial [Bacteroidales bacterium]|nr:dTDP-4-dehydrorhamnose 3,5-epimerase family protein [Bacteroidales bacterium]
MEIKQTDIPGLLLMRPRVFGDARGYFMESYAKRTWEAAGLHAEFVQDNESCSAKGVLRGLHFQTPPQAQAKLVRVVRGAVWDVAVDLRVGSPTYGQWYGVELNAD